MKMTAAETSDVNVDGVLDGARFGALSKLVLLCAGCITVLDGFDIQIMGLAAPSIAKDWGMDRAALAPALAAALLGMALGGFTFGWVGDRFGRRPALLISALLFGGAALLTAFSPNLTMLIALRLVTGIGLGGALPNATAMMAEFSPPRVRSQVIAVAIIGVPIGGIMGAAIGSSVIPTLGWRAMFLIGGMLPLLATFAIYRFLPESPRFLVHKSNRKGELASLLNRIDGSDRFEMSNTFRTEAPILVEQSGARALWSKELRHDTCAVWVAFITNLFAVYCFYNWGPVVLTGVGLPIASAVRALMIFNIFGVVGALVAARLIARLGSRWIQVILCVLAIGTLLQLRAMLGHPAEPVIAWKLMTALAFAGFCILAIQVTLFAVAAHVYPTRCRSSGVGWAQSMGRLGGILSSVAGVVLVGGSFFGSIAATLAITGLAIVFLKNHLPPITQKP